MPKMWRPDRTFLATLFSFMGILSFMQILLLPACAATTAAQTPPAPEGKFIQDLGDKTAGLNVDTRLTPGQLDAQYRNMLDDSFDIDAINQYVIGRTWEQATPEQKQEYLKLFRQFVIKTYGSPLRFHPGDGLRIGNISPQNEKDTDVSTEIAHSDGTAPTPVDWIVRRKDSGRLAIIDVIVNGVSLNATQRDQFTAILASNGGDFNALLNALRHKVP